MLLFVILFFLAGVFMLRLVYANEKQQMYTQYKKLCLRILSKYLRTLSLSPRIIRSYKKIQ